MCTTKKLSSVKALIEESHLVHIAENHLDDRSHLVRIIFVFQFSGIRDRIEKTLYYERVP